MNKHALIIGVAVLLTTICLSGCNGEQNNQNQSQNINLDGRLFGTWLFAQGALEQTYTFDSDGTFSFNDVEMGTYATNNGKLMFTYENTEVTITTDYSFSNNYTELSIIDENGNEMVYTKQ